jgi:hypothetical protein
MKDSDPDICSMKNTDEITAQMDIAHFEQACAE